MINLSCSLILLFFVMLKIIMSSVLQYLAASVHAIDFPCIHLLLIIAFVVCYYCRLEAVHHIHVFMWTLH